MLIDRSANGFRIFVNPSLRDADKIYREINEYFHERDKLKSEFVNEMRMLGVSIIHLDDGWVNRKDNTLVFCYPTVIATPTINSLCCLGSPEKYRIVRLLKFRKWMIPAPGAPEYSNGTWSFAENIKEALWTLQSRRN